MLRHRRAAGPVAAARAIADVVVDGKSGVSGAGRDATPTTHFVSVTENVQAYKVEGHRHAAELEQELNGASFTFVPHLVPVEQGLLASCYATTGLDAQAVLDRYRDAYADEPFIDLVDEPPGTDDVRETNRCRIQVTVVGERVSRWPRSTTSGRAPPDRRSRT